MTKDFIEQQADWSRDFEKDVPGYLRQTLLLIEEEFKEFRTAANFAKTVGTHKERMEWRAYTIGEALDLVFLLENLVYKIIKAQGYSHEVSIILTRRAKQRLIDANNSKRWPDGNVYTNPDGKVVTPQRFVHPMYHDLLAPPVITLTEDDINRVERKYLDLADDI